MSWTRRVKHPSKILKIGDTVEAVVLDIDVKQNRISLGMKQLEPNPYEQAHREVPAGHVVKGKVRNIADFGVSSSRSSRGIDGLVHITDLSWTQRVKHPSELFKKGDEVRRDGPQHRQLGREAEDQPRPQAARAGPVGPHPVRLPDRQDRRGQDPQAPDFGAFAELEPGVEGLIHISEISEERVEDPRTHLEPGQKIRAEIIQMDAQERKIGLSIKSARRQDDLADAQGFTNASEAGATLGDVFGRLKRD
jgi:small subunit ribosomal protein S1